MNDYLTMLVITAVTGVGGLALGGALATALHSPSDRSISLLLRFTAGVILSLVCFDLIADALGQAGIVPVICWIMIGCLCTYLLNCWIDRQAHHSHSHGGRQEQALLEDHGGHDHHSHHDREPLVRDNGEMCACGHHTLHTAGLVLAAAVALHNVPVGMAVGATVAVEGICLASVLAAVTIGLHNLPEGMSIAIPLLHDGSKTLGAIGVAALSGLPTVAGALAGYFVGSEAPGALAAALSLAGGAMLYVVFFELLPEASLQWRSRWSILATVVGFALGVLLIFGHGHH